MDAKLDVNFCSEKQNFEREDSCSQLGMHQNFAAFELSSRITIGGFENAGRGVNSSLILLHEF